MLSKKKEKTNARPKRPPKRTQYTRKKKNKKKNDISPNKTKKSEEDRKYVLFSYLSKSCFAHKVSIVEKVRDQGPGPWHRWPPLVPPLFVISRSPSFALAVSGLVL